MNFFKEYDPDSGLIFVHIPKTAGTTFRKALQNQATWVTHEFYDNSPHALANVAAVTDENKKILKDHIILGHINHEMWREIDNYIDHSVAQLCTILRHPADIIFSNYFYIKMLEKKQGSIYGFVDSYINQKYSPYFTYLPRPESDLHTYINQNFVWIGLSENLAATVNAGIFADSVRLGEERVNESFYDEPIPESLLAKIQAAYPVEFELFGIVQHHYEKNGISIPLQTKRSENINVLLDQIKSLNEMLEIERERVAAERTISRKLRTWAEHAEQQLAAEKEISDKLRGTSKSIRISLVTACLNAGKTIERTLKSIEAQQYPALEYIIFDGGSTDDTLNIIERYKHIVTKVVSEKDKNVPDANNKGFRHATGEIFCYLNADDCFEMGALAHVARAFAENPSVDVVTGGCRRVFADGSILITQVPEHFLRLMSMRNDIEQPSTFWRASAHRRAGELDDTYFLSFDWEWWNRLQAGGARFIAIPDVLSVYYFTDNNLTSKAGQRVIDEMYRVTKRYGPKGVADVYRFLFRVFDMHGFYDVPFRELPWLKQRLFGGTLTLLYKIFGRDAINAYNWNWASKQIRGVVWYK